MEKLLPFQVFEHAIKAPAYKAFLESAGFKKKTISSIDEFALLPQMEKKSYMANFSGKDYFPNKEVPPFSYASSGSSGTPTFWYRNTDQLDRGALLHEEILKNTFGISPKEDTLVVIAFSLGLWVAGMFTANCFEELAKKNWNITLATPGIDFENIYLTLSSLASNYQNVVIAGHPPFLMHVLQGLKAKRFQFRKKYFLFTAGDKFSESWRDTALKMINRAGDFTAVHNLYGSSDAGPMAFETPATVAVRRAALENKKLAESLFGTVGTEPGLFQYDPKNIYFEEIEGELVVTAPTAVPLVRYNIHDIGRVYQCSDVEKMLKEAGAWTKEIQRETKRFNKPFVVKGGRTDVAVTFYAINLHPEQLSAWTLKSGLLKELTGAFTVYKKEVKNPQGETLTYEIQLKEGVKTPGSLRESLKKRIVAALKTTSTEFTKLLWALGEKAEPEIVFAGHNAGLTVPKGATGLQFIPGKKPKIVR